MTSKYTICDGKPKGVPPPAREVVGRGGGYHPRKGKTMENI